MANERWRATVFYRTESGPLDIEHDLDELADLHDKVEAGPHWDTIIRIEVVRINHCDGVNLTVEKAATL